MPCDANSHPLEVTVYAKSERNIPYESGLCHLNKQDRVICLMNPCYIASSTGLPDPKTEVSTLRSILHKAFAKPRDSPSLQSYHPLSRE